MKYKYPLLSITLVLMAVGFIVFKSQEPDDCPLLVNAIKESNFTAAIRQLIIVKQLETSKAEITCCQKSQGTWQRRLPKFLALIGKQGIAARGEKKEGDLKTPSGLFPLGEVFGSIPLAVKMDYKYISSEDKFIDDPSSPAYNTWVNGKTEAKSYEPMLIPAYKMGAILNYNTNPTIHGAGSGIFLHLRDPTGKATQGCIAMNARHLSALLHWLDKPQHPHIFISAKMISP